MRLTCVCRNGKFLRRSYRTVPCNLSAAGYSSTASTLWRRSLPRWVSTSRSQQSKKSTSARRIQKTRNMIHLWVEKNNFARQTADRNFSHLIYLPYSLHLLSIYIFFSFSSISFLFLLSFLFSKKFLFITFINLHIPVKRYSNYTWFDFIEGFIEFWH